MSVTEQSVLNQGLLFHDDIVRGADDRTLAILEQRRKTAVIRRRGWLIRRMLLLADVIGLSLAFVLAWRLIPVGGARLDRISPAAENALFVFVMLPAWVLGAKLHGLYDHDEERTDHTTPDDLARVVHLVTLGIWVLFVGAWVTHAANPDPPKLVILWGLAIVFVTLARAVARAVARRQITYLQNTVIVGAGDVGQLVARKFLQHPEYGINLVGFVDSQPKDRRDDLGHLSILGPIERLPAVVRLFDVERVVIAFSNESHEATLDLIRSLKDLDVQIDIVPRLFEVVGPKVGIHTVEGVPLVGLPPLRLARSSRLLKRLMDVVLAGTALVVLAPLFGLIALRIKLDSPGPVFFRQIRMGFGNQIFRIYKFRTMAADADARKNEVAHLNMHARNGGDPRMFKVPDDPRVTRFGAFLRRTSIDELPQLINVFKGEMSLVGPRPLILDEDQYVAEWARKRLDLKPGITGLWQVLGRSEIPFEEMTKLDYLYVTNWSLWGDVNLLVQTVPALFRARHAY
jgi:exopolysaccharide biosynthesis polyprenyl glycosylphosphotransferase